MAWNVPVFLSSSKLWVYLKGSWKKLVLALLLQLWCLFFHSALLRCTSLCLILFHRSFRPSLSLDTALHHDFLRRHQSFTTWRISLSHLPICMEPDLIWSMSLKWFLPSSWMRWPRMFSLDVMLSLSMFWKMVQYLCCRWNFPRLPCCWPWTTWLWVSGYTSLAGLLQVLYLWHGSAMGCPVVNVRFCEVCPFQVCHYRVICPLWSSFHLPSEWTFGLFFFFALLVVSSGDQLTYASWMCEEGN